MKLKNYLLIAAFFSANNYTVFGQPAFSFPTRLLGDVVKIKRDALLKVTKKTIFFKTVLALLMVLLSLTSYSQTYKAFSIREKIDIRGSMVVAGNNILGKDNLPFNDNTKSNQDIAMKYIDIDSDVTTFSSSSADLLVPKQKDGSPSSCYRIAYAALYWGAMLQSGSRTDINKVKLKLPGASTYNEITGEVIYDAAVNPIIPDANKPYACYANVTGLLSGLSSLAGTYTVANVTAGLGSNGTTGLSAGWTLFVVYEDPSLHMKSFNIFDGFSHVYSSHFEKIPVTGFITPPSGNIDLQFAYAALDGDKPQGGTKLEFGTKEVTTPLRSANRFFNSTIENTNGVSTPRNPSGTNTLGYDTGVLEVKSAQPEYVNNNQTSTDFTLQVAKGQADPVFVFFNAYAVDIISPKIDLTKLVKNTSGVNVGGANVVLGQYLTYEISYQSVGNDNVNNFTIKDVLPTNIIFDSANGIDYTNAGGATLQSYDATTRTIIFKIPNSSVLVNGSTYTIRLNVQIVPDCNLLSDACSNIIMNQAFATYSGIINPKIVQEEGSFDSTACKLGSPQSTNFLVDITNCKFTQKVVLCGASVVLSASDGYNNYSWSTSSTGSPIIGTNKTFTATQTGIYYVRSTSTSTCLPITEEITVIPFGNTVTNPVIPFADQVVTCPNNGKLLPNIFLCGLGDIRSINTGITDALSIVWEKLNEGSCAVAIPNCANEDNACTWSQVGTGANYNANTSGQFRITINYTGGCFSRFYFNVYQNLLNPTFRTKDIICTTVGQIIVENVPAGYEYSLDGGGNGIYQSSNIFPNADFPVVAAGYHTVYIKQIGVATNPCKFPVPNILIRQRNFKGEAEAIQPLCNGDSGSIILRAYDALPQYYYSVYQGTTLVNSVGPIMASEYTFSGLNPGVYKVRVWTDDGCDYLTDVEIKEPALLTATSALTKPFTCLDGEITVYPIGGTPPYTYYINGTDNFQFIPQIVVTNPLPTGGIYTVIVEDSNNCRATTTITVAATPPPVYTVSKTDIKCYNDSTGAINFNVTNTNGYTLAYSIDNGVTYAANSAFSNLVAGTYNTIVRYTLGTSVCYGTMEVVSITQPTAALTASAGVSELAGCGPSGEGKISITNPQGGTAPYEYSFDNQATWATVSNAYKAPGNYTLYIRDINGCIYTMPNIIIEPRPVQPTIAATDPVFNCDGTATSTVTVTTIPNANYSYQYLLDGVSNTNIPSNIFVGVTSGNHTISVKYNSSSTALSCIPQSDFYFVVASGNAFTAAITSFKAISCSGVFDGTITIAAQNFDTTKGFQYSNDNGVTWFTQMTSPYTITGLANGTYAVQIRYDATSTGTCVKTFSQIITAPTPLTVTASVTTAATCATGATVTPVGAGGTLAYQYEIRDAAGVAVIRPYQLNAQFTNVPTGNYTVFVKDANECISAVGAAINIVAPPTLTVTLDTGSDICFDSLNQASLIVNASGGTPPFTYSLNGAAAQNSNTFTSVGTGTHNIVVTDSYNCTATINNIVIAPQLIAVANTTKTLDCTTSPNAVITATISGGTAPFTVTVLSGTGPGTIAQPTATTFTYTTAVASIYKFQIKDANGCITTATASVNALVPITATTIDVNPSCNGALDGSVQIIPSGGVGPYTYSSDGITYVSGSLFSGLGDGTYTFYIKDSNACFITKTVTLTQPTALVTLAMATAFSCSTTNTKQSATITIEVPTKGTAPYQYSFNGGGYTNTNTLTLNDNGSDQIISYSVKDAKGCIYTNTVTLLKLNPPTDLSFTAAPITCSATTTTVTATATNGVGPLTYAITFPMAAATSNTTGVFAGLSPGTYIFKVTDANGCYYSESYVVNPVTPIAVIGNKLSDILCNGGNTGAVRYTVSGFSGTYSYSVNGGSTITGQTATTINLTNQSAGTFAILITDEVTGCTANASITITQPSVLVASSATATHVNCNNDESQITITASGGTANYTYAAVISGATAPTTYSNSTIITVDTNSATNLIWDVYVRDAKGCIATTTVTVISDALPTIDTPAIQCYVGSPINISIIGTSVGVPTYSIGSGYQSSPNFTINASGTYTLSLKDASGCIATTTYIVYPQLTVLPAITKELDCTASPAATITVTAAGGKNPYSYAVSTDGGSMYAAMGTNVYSTLVAGTFQFRVTDANNCISTATATVNPLVPITATPAKVDPSCNGALDGSVQIIPSGGVGPYTYSSDGTTYVSGSLFIGLGDGTYTFYIKDSKECFITKTVTLSQPTTLVASATATAFSCSATNTKQSATIIIPLPTTGTAPYQYSFNGGGYTNINTLTVNDNGTDQTIPYSVRDANGCTAGNSIILSKLNPPTAGTITNSAVTCNTTTSTVTVTPAAGTGVGTLTYEIVFPVAAATSNTTGVFAGLSPGTYIFKVTDANGCYYTESHIVNPVTPIALTGNKLNDVLCKGDNSGSIQYTVSGFSSTYSYVFNGQAALTGQTSTSIIKNGLPIGTYLITVTDEATGCTANNSITITEPTDALMFTTAASNVNCNNDNSQITVTPSGGTPNYTYAAVISGAAAPTTYGNSNIIIVDTNSGANLSWDVYVKDANGCVTNNIPLPTTVTLDPMPTVTTTPLTTDQCTSNGSSYSFTATGTGVAPLTYSIGGSFQASPIFTLTATGLYTITVKDGNGCTNTTTIMVYPVLTATAVLTADLDCIAPTDATIRIDAGGGKVPYSYLVSVNGAAYGSTGISGNVFTTNSAGTFLFEVTDANGCKKISNPITINPKVDPEITLLDQIQDIYCNGEATASIKATIDTNKGIGPFTYNIDGTNFQVSNVFSGLVAGTYTVTVKDSKGCTNSETIIIGQPDALDFTLSKTDIACTGPPPAINLGSITVDVGSGLGGKAPYTYILTNNVGDPTQTESNNPGTNFTFTGLNYGTYAVSIVDANGCTLKQNITVTSPPNDLTIDIQSTASCSAGGTVKVTATSGLLGAGPFYFAIYQRDAVSGLYPGVPNVIAGVPDAPYITEDTPGTPTATFTGLTQGVIYSFIVYDSATGCSYIKQASVATIKATSLATLRVVTDVTCKGAADGTVSITLDKEPTAPIGYSPPTTIDYVVYNSLTNFPIDPANQDSGLAVGAYPYTMPLIGGLSPGSYYVVITEHGGTNDGCSSATLPFDIYESVTDLEVNATVVKNDNCSSEAGQIVAIAQGGTTVSREDPLAVPPQVSVPVPYQYQILPDNGTIGDASDDTPPTFSDSNWATDNFFEKDSGNYIVYAMDANKCIKSFPITLSLDPSPVITLAATDKCAVEGAFEIVVNEATAGVAPYSISVNGSAYQNFSFVPGTPNSYTISNLNSGTYNISVQDVNGCVDTESITLYKKVSANSVLNKVWTCTTGDVNALITTNIFDGQGVFSYKVSINGGGYGSSTNIVGNNFTFSPAPMPATTNYQFEITDANGCTVETNVITIEPIENPTATTIIANATCDYTPNGSITIIPSLGVPPYTFNFNGNGFTSNVTYGGLAGSVAGTVYNYQVKDSYDCIFNGTATVFEPTPVAGTIDLSQGLTCGAGNATQSATVTVTTTLGTGTAPYYYSFNGGASYSSNNVFTTNVAVNVNALIKDGNGCVIATPLSVNVPTLIPPTDLTFSTTSAVTCLAPGTVEITGHTGGVGILQYETIAPSPIIVPQQTTTTFANLTPGTYLFQVTDANFCTYQESYTVNPVINITVSGQLVSDVTCNPGTNGQVLFTLGNFAGTYTYSINGGAVSAPQSNPTITVSGLSAASTQTIVVADVVTGCTATTSINVAQSAPLSLVANPFINANCNFGAQVSVTASGGVAPYSYSYVISGMPAGTYSTSASAVLDPAVATSWDVYVKDANNCVITTPLAITITKDALPIIVMPASQCFVGVPLTIDLSIGETVAVGPATYAINGSNQTSPTYIINAPGTYQLSIVDANGCSSNVVDYIVQPQLLLNAALTKELDCTTSPDAVVTLTAGGGTTSYTLYEYSTNAGASYTAMGSNVLTTSTAGSYIFRVTDSQGCQAVSSEVTITPQTTPTFTFTQTNVSCNGGSDGSIVITAANGIAPYQYSIDNGATYQLSNVFTGLNAAGTYTVVVKDSKSCASATSSLTITEPTIVSGTAFLTQGLTCGAGNATQAALVTVTGSGGTGSYEYSFDGGVNYTASNTYSTNSAGMVTSYIKDANGCISTVPAIVNVPALNPPTNLDFVSTAVTCLAMTSDVRLTATNGVSTLSYEILSPASATSNVTGVSSAIFAGLLPDTYLFQVTDANFCTYQESYTVNPVTNITVSGQLISDVTCNPGTNGQVLFTVANFSGTYTYSINGGAVSLPQSNPTITVSGLSTASTQTIVVTDVVTGCTATTFIAVAQPAPLALVANTFINANCNFGAQVSVTASGGVAPYGYSYVISGAPAGTYSTSASAVLDQAIATSWDVYVKDTNNCVITTPLTIAIATDPLPSGITVSGLSQCPSATGDYTFTVNLATGVGPYEFSIGSGFQTSPTFTINAHGTYDVIVKDKNGCSTTATALVVILPALQLQANITALPSCADGDGTLTLLATGGSGNYEYSIDSGMYQASVNFTNIFVGIHTVTVRDVTTNCTKSIPVTFGAATLITGFALSKTDVTCNGGNDGTIAATMNTPAVGVNDNPIYTYSIDGGATTQTSTIFSGLIAGTYIIGVTSGRGCVATQTITVNEPNLITVPAPTVVQFGCNSGSNAMNFATITVTGVTGGSGVYTNYEFIKGGTRVQFGASNRYTEANLLGGTYTVNVYDNKGCMGAASSAITLNPFIVLDKINIAVNNAITCMNLEDITVSVSSIGGTPTNLQYTVADSNTTTGVVGANYNFTNTIGIFTGLNSGNYLITVENLDTGCSIQNVHYVNNPNTFDLTIDTIVDVTCFNGNNGSVNVTFIDRVVTATNPNQSGPFNYTIVDALGNPVTAGTAATAGPITINTLVSGTFTITATLTNSPFCSMSKNFTITQPIAALAIAETHTAVTCVTGNNDGSIAVSAVGGWPGGYEFELTGPTTLGYSTQRNFTDLIAGTYTINVRDRKGCVATTSVTLAIPTPIIVTASSNIAMLSCFGDKTATITVNLPSGGQGSNYMYTLNTTSLVPATASGPQASPVFNGLGAGTYTITVTDGYSCAATSSPIVITEPTKIKSSLVVASTQTCLTQTMLTLSATGGTGIYSYSANAAFTTILGSFASSVTFSVPVGTYHYYVMDANGCVGVVSNDIEIVTLETLILNVNTINAIINCKGDLSGVIVSSAQGGLGNYAYTLLDGAGIPIVPAPTQITPGNFTQLAAGNYKVRVDSGDCNIITGTPIVIKEPLTSISVVHTEINVTCFGQGNGQITVAASGGTGIIKYAISPRLDQFFNLGIFVNLQPGLYDIIAQDENGCYQYITGIVISEPNPIVPSLTAGSMLPEICFGDKDGAFNIDIVGGTMPYSVSLDNTNGVYTTGTLIQTQFDFTGLAGGTHTVYIRDANGCAVEFDVVMPESVKINPLAIVDYGCVNNSASNSVTVKVDASITDLTDLDYSLDGAPYQPTNVFTNVVPGANHFIDVRHTNGCIQRTATFDILQVNPLALVLNDGGLNEIVAVATGGAGGYQYTFNGESNGSSNSFIIRESGDYTVTVTDANGCVATASRYFEFIDVCIPNYFTPNGDGVMDGWAPGCTINYKDLTFDVFDRYGRKIATYRLGQYWDGKYNGNELPSGDYWYVLKLNDLKDAREFVGHFTLYR
ncbi:T9SS type B sorting domain-containing protein [Flavobacterium sp. LT1R49]|uniref:T9SS type B sorting domain-containing protein n=1 Tax=Flavobacterium arabinosi TaxID=3398737 RepID=UPI003A84F9A2